MLQRLQLSTSFLTIISKLPQIMQNYSNGHTGMSSLISTGLAALGSTARVFTGFKEIGDVSVLFGAVVGAFLNCILTAQIMLSKIPTTPIKKKTKNSAVSSAPKKKS